MNKRSLAKKFNAAEPGMWSDITTERIKLTAASFTEQSEESMQEINVLVDKYCSTFFSKAIMKKVVNVKSIVIWPQDASPFTPIVDRVEVFRISANRAIMLIRVM
jgi:hypothetical protein